MLRGAVAVAIATLAGAVGGAAPAVADDGALVVEGAVVASAEVVLRKGDRGPAVRRLQRRLDVAADGIFGSQTAKAVKRFQRRKGLEVDGIVGPATRQALGLAQFSSVGLRRAAPVKADGLPPGVRLPRVLQRIAECESGGNPRAISPGGTYRGKYQFSRATWKAMGGRGSDPAKASEAHQDRVALKLYRAQGTSPWPSCGA